MKDEIERVKNLMDKAISMNNGFLAHHYGSQLMHYKQLETNSKMRLRQQKEKSINLRYECDINGIHNMISYLINYLPDYNIFNKRKKLKEHEETLDSFYKRLHETQEKYHEDMSAIQ